MGGEIIGHRFPSEEEDPGTSLGVQWSRISLPMQGAKVWSLVWEDSTRHGATWVRAPQLRKPPGPKAGAPQQEKPPEWEGLAPQWGGAPVRHN